MTVLRQSEGEPDETPVYRSLADVAASVDANGGIVTLPMWEVREAHGAGRLGVNVCRAISAELDQLGLGYFPATLPANQTSYIRLWKKTSQVGKLMQAALGRKHRSDRRDEGERWQECDSILREAYGKEANVILGKIIALISDRSPEPK
jgi:hypothetical protein